MNPAPLEGWSATTRSSRRFSRRFAFLLLVPLLFGVLGGPGAHVARVGADELADARARQDALNAQIKNQKAAVAQIAGLQQDLSRSIASTKSELNGINADLGKVRVQINGMVARINVVKAEYLALVGQLGMLDDQLARVEVEEAWKRVQLAQRKAELAQRIRDAYDADRTSMLETFLSGGNFSDVLSEVSYINDFAEADKKLAQQIALDQEALATLHETVLATRSQTDDLRAQTAAQKAQLDLQLTDLKTAQARLKQLEQETARALAVQKAAYAKLLRSKKDLAKSIAIAAAAQRKLEAKINDLITAQVNLGNIPSVYNGTLNWPMVGNVTNEFGCSSYPGYAPGNGCEHFHNGIDIVAPNGCGAPIKAAGAGRVAYIGWNYADGADPAWIVIIVHSQDLQTWYAHMKAHTYPSGITTGSLVQSGQIIGYEDATGRATGCHLHWMVEWNGEFRNPRLFV